MLTITEQQPTYTMGPRRCLGKKLKMFLLPLDLVPGLDCLGPLPCPALDLVPGVGTTELSSLDEQCRTSNMNEAARTEREKEELRLRLAEKKRSVEALHKDDENSLTAMKHIWKYRYYKVAEVRSQYKLVFRLAKERIVNRKFVSGWTSTIAFLMLMIGVAVFYYLDDFAGVEKHSEAMFAFNTLGNLLEKCGIEESPNTSFPLLKEIKFLIKALSSKDKATKREVQPLLCKLKFKGACGDDFQDIKELYRVEDEVKNSLNDVPVQVKKDLVLEVTAKHGLLTCNNSLTAGKKLREKLAIKSLKVYSGHVIHCYDDFFLQGKHNTPKGGDIIPQKVLRVTVTNITLQYLVASCAALLLMRDEVSLRWKYGAVIWWVKVRWCWARTAQSWFPSPTQFHGNARYILSERYSRN
ncbi:LOW QUALITY PROTEIN: hypothetical protein MAR_028468 [Mya arenaria]|uniref:Uncharacterized protein n=1 Tax=Mya arenaria TaxID=6604 RepID=A0ABY7DER6_MYAAR|nr:LOW QUALITY PROTEIN: hypothetical protein MAR_028468 [Mya arenaria]